MYGNVTQVRNSLKCTVSGHNIYMAILINILYQETAINAVFRRIELVLYFRKHDLYAWNLF